MLTALKWSAVDRIAQQGIQFVIGIILARLLCPADYGLIGMIMVFAQIAYVMVESGLGSALVRTQDYTEKHANTVFYTNLLISATIYLILFFSAPFIASFFNQPQLTAISRIMFLAILFNAFYIVPFNMCVRQMDYKTIAKVNLISTTLSGLGGILLAFCDFGVWALALQQIGYHFFRMICFYIFSKWIPKLEYSIKILKEYIPFSFHILCSSLLTVIFNNLYTFLIGKCYSVNKVGFYTQANKMSDTVNFTFQAILNSTYSLFSKINNDIERLCATLRSIVQKINMISIPLAGFLIVSAKPLFFLLLGEKWLDAVPYFQILCAANIFAPVYQVNIHAVNSIGKSKNTFYIELTKRILILVSVVVCLILKTDIFMMLICYAVCCWISYAISAFSVKKWLTLYYKWQIMDLYKGVGVAALIALCCFMLTNVTENLYITLLIQFICATAIYILYNWLFNRQMASEIISLTKRRNDEE